MSFKFTVDLDVGGFPAGSSPTDIAKAITRCYPNHDSLRVVSIQQCPKKVARVTFDKLDGRAHLLEAKELRMIGEFKGVTCRVIPPPVPPTPWSTVMVYNYPYEFPNESVESVMKGYGEVGGVRCQSWVDLPGVATGTRLVRMRRKFRIPRFLYIGNFRCKVWYKGQPVVCDICNVEGHTAGACSLRGKCRLCEQPGHMAKSCPLYCYRCKGSHPGVECTRIWGNRPLVSFEEDVDVTDGPPLSSSVDSRPGGSSGPVSEGPGPPSAADSPSVDLRDNELDELGSQSGESSMSQSVLPNPNACNASDNVNCDVNGTSNVMDESNVRNENETSNVINGSNVSKESGSSNVMNQNNVNNVLGTSNVMNESNVNNESEISNEMNGSNYSAQSGSSQINGQTGDGLSVGGQIDGLIGHIDGEVSPVEFISPPVPSPGDIRLASDVDFSDASAAGRKRSAEDLSDDSGGASVSCKVPSGGRNTRKPKASRGQPAVHSLPGNVGAVVNIAYTRSSSRS